MVKYNKKILAIGIAFIGLFILGIIGLTYAFFIAGVVGNPAATPTVIETGILRLIFTDTNLITMNNALPGATATKTFTIENTGTVKVKYNLNLIDLTNTFTNNELVYSITSDNGGGVVVEEVLPMQGDILVISEIEPGITQTYTLTIKFKETGSNQNINQGAIFTGKLEVDATIHLITFGGYVYDENGNSLSNVIVEMHSDPIITTTNAFGYYEIQDVPEGDHIIYIKNGETILGTKEIKIFYTNKAANLIENSLKLPNLYKDVNIKVAQELNIQFEKLPGTIIKVNNFGGNNNDNFYKNVATSDGGSVAVGYTQSTDISGITNKGYEDAIIVKYDASGNEVWKKNFGGSNYEEFYEVVAVADGYIAAGYSSSIDISGITNKGSNDAIIVKYDASGNEVWKKNFGGSSEDNFKAITLTADGGVIALGNTKSTNISGITNKGSQDGIIVKYNSSGTEVWKKNFGGASLDEYYGITSVTDGYIATGITQSSDISGVTLKGGIDAIVTRFDLNGNVIWNKNFGGSGNDYFYKTTAESDGGSIAVGYSMSTDITSLTNKGGRDSIIVKYDASGNEVWKKNFGGSNNDEFNNITSVADGYLALGYIQSTDISGMINNGFIDATLVKYDLSGNEVWKKNFGGSSADYFNSLIETSNEYLVIGYTASSNILGITKKGGTYDAIIVNFTK